MTEILKCFDLHFFRKHHGINKINSIETSVDMIEMYLQESDEETDETDETTIKKNDIMF